MKHFYPYKFCLRHFWRGVITYRHVPLLVAALLLAVAHLGYAQTIRVTGKVTAGDDGSPVPGATVLVQGTTNGTITDINGDYSLQVDDPNAVLVFSYVGYLTEEIPVNNRSVIDISLMADITELMEVVVVGYGTVQKKDLTGSVAVVDGSSIAERGTVSPLQAVQGQVAGVDISAGSGRAGSDFSIQIRGQNSLVGGSPLYVVDGVIVDNINFINPQDIERMDILKDASSTAIYGSRGSNGVVLVTTKQGTGVKGGANISYDGYVGVRQNVRQPDFMDGDEWFRFRQNTFIMQNLSTGNYDETIGGLANAPYITARRVALKEYTDWPSHFLQTGLQQNHWISASGVTSDSRMSYVLGGGYQEEKGNLLKDHFSQYNFKASINHRINDQWTAGASFNFSLSETERGSQHAITNAYRMSPLASPYDSLGNILYQPAKYGDVNYTSSVNPLVDIENSQDNTRRTQGVGNIYLEFSPVEWISIRSTMSPQFRNQRRGRFHGSETEARQLKDPSANLDQREYFSYIWDNQLNITKNLEDHSFNFTGLYSQQYQRGETSYINVENLPFASGFHNLGTAKDYQDVRSSYTQETLISYMARLNYSFRDRYLLTLSNRWDGSSVLAKGHKWASFPSAAIGWRVSEEAFMQDVSFIRDLKARISYGYTGNNNISPFSTQVLANNQTYYDFGGTNAGGFAPSGIVNPELTWERTREFNFGLDYELLRGRISGSIDVYDKLSTKLLMERDLPIETGAGALYDNIGSVSNKGFELFLNTINIQTNDFSWSTIFNFSKNNNEIIEIFGGDVSRFIGGSNASDRYAWIVGQDININYTYVWDGIWQKGEDAAAFGSEEGQVKIRDISGPDGTPDGKIDADYDWVPIGSSSPDWTGGFSTQFTYKGFDLSASLFTRQGVQVFSPFHQEFTNLGDRGRGKLNVDYYMPENKVNPTNYTNNYPRPMTPGTQYNEVAFFKDASFVKVQNIALGYNFPSTGLLERANIKSLRLYLNVLNPFVFTDYDGFDPEWADKSLESTGNAFVTYQFGVNLKF